MATYNLNQVKVGLKIVVDGDPCVIVAADVVKPGKGQAFTKVKYKNYKTERVNGGRSKRRTFLKAPTSSIPKCSTSTRTAGPGPL